jgi:ABC-type transporter MlaC component
MFARTKHFDEYWRIAKNEYHDAFVEYVNEQIAIARDAAQQDGMRRPASCNAVP